VPVEAIDHRLGNAPGEHVLNSGYVHGGRATRGSDVGDCSTEPAAAAAQACRESVKDGRAEPASRAGATLGAPTQPSRPRTRWQIACIYDIIASGAAGDICFRQIPRAHVRSIVRSADPAASTPLPGGGAGTRIGYNHTTLHGVGMSASLIKVPQGGQKIIPGQAIPDNPIIPFIEGDGIGIDITPVMIKVVDAAVAKAYGGARRSTGWKSTPARNRPRCTVPTSGCRPRRSTRSRNTRCRSRGR
jgi:hypothetical protein